MFFNFSEDYYDRDERKSRRHRDRDRDTDRYYGKSGGGRDSQNTSDREYDRSYQTTRRSRGYDSQGYYPQYPGYNHTNYNYNTYYQQQAYLESLRLTNPQAYEWYKNYYSMMMQQSQMQPQQPTSLVDDIGGSLRSGYSSSNERDRYDECEWF
jgi:hypothetical protein